MNIDEVKEKIKNKEYPHVARLSEPYLTRLSELTLVVNDITYTAKIKDGVNVQGFMIYSSGLGIPVYEDLEKKNNGDFNGKSKLKESTDKARKWIDELEIVIAETINDSPIKKAIDRLNWQMHYDITSSEYDMKSLEDFADVDIDMGTEVDGLYTVHNTMIDAAEIITVGGTGSETGTLSKIASNIETLYTNVNTMNTTFRNYDTHMESYLIGSSGSSIYSILKTTSNMICNPADDRQTLWNALRDNNGFSIARALRDSTDGNYNPLCVASEVKKGCADVATKTETRTQTEDAAFGEIEGRIGEPGSNNSVWDTVLNINGGVAIHDDNSTGGDENKITLWEYASGIGRPDTVQVQHNNKTLFEQIGYDTDYPEYTITQTLLHDCGTMNPHHNPENNSMYNIAANINSNVSTINSNVSTINSNVTYIKGAFTDQNVNGSSYRIVHATLPVSYDNNLW